MPDWQMQTITDETMPRLPESKYHRMGGWLLFLVIWMAAQSANGLAIFAVLIKGLMQRGGMLTGGMALYLALQLTPALLIGIALLLLFCRKLSFRIPFTVYAVFQIAFAIANIVENPGWSIAAYALAAPLFAAWIVYFFTSDRVRVYCNKRPKRPVPMPEEAMAHWDASGQIYTDEDGVVTDFSTGPVSALPYHFINMPSGWRMTARRTQQQEE